MKLSTRRRSLEQAHAKVLAIMQPGCERERLRASAQGEDWSLEFCISISQALGLLRSSASFAAVVFDRDVPGIQWEEAVQDLSGSAGRARIILASAHYSDGLWERVVEHGGHDLLARPLEADEVRRAVLHALWYSITSQSAT